jgi:hypothetical protein
MTPAHSEGLIVRSQQSGQSLQARPLLTAPCVGQQFIPTGIFEAPNFSNITSSDAGLLKDQTLKP